jgi:tRNA (guanine-N7-)-methyltransferase
MLWLDRLLESVLPGRLQMVTIHFPDPWFKKRHAKRRMVTRELVETVAAKLADHGRIFVQTDIDVLADEMFELFRSNEELNESEINASPFSVKTEREKAVEQKGLNVYRRLFTRK